ncbi:MAG: hypothetical protein H6Q13_2525 [Bacteroidetes bacterium]|nr:hypothetical protein [Bacteroidota bacterium]
MFDTLRLLLAMSLRILVLVGMLKYNYKSTNVRKIYLMLLVLFRVCRECVIHLESSFGKAIGFEF